jgi:hypothetical protein
MQHAKTAALWTELTLEDRRERRRLRRKYKDNILRAAKMHVDRPKIEKESPNPPHGLKPLAENNANTLKLHCLSPVRLLESSLWSFCCVGVFRCLLPAPIGRAI